MVNETISNGIVSKGVDALTKTSQTVTEKITDILIEQGFNVTPRWTSLLVLAISIGIIFLGIKISQPLIKWGLILISILLIAGLLIPW